MDEQELKARVSGALERRALEAPRLKAFYMDMAEAGDSSVSSVKNWMKQVCAPDSAALLNLFDNVPGFEAEVRGDRPAPPDINKAREYAEKLLRELGIRDDEGVVAADFTQNARPA